MKNSGKHFLIFACLAAASLVLVFLSEGSTVVAAAGTLPGLDINSGAKSFNLDFLPSFISNPINYLINTGKQMLGGFTGSVTRLNIGNLGTNNAFSDLNDWFLGTTGGISLVQVLRFVGNTIASILSFLSDMIQRGVSAL